MQWQELDQCVQGADSACCVLHALGMTCMNVYMKNSVFLMKF